METDLAVGLVLTALAFAGLIWAVFHGKYVVERVMENEYPHHPNPDHRPPPSGGAAETEGGSSSGSEGEAPRG